MTWSQESAGCGWRRTGHCGTLWGRPTSSSGRLSADMMMMIIGQNENNNYALFAGLIILIYLQNIS
jgi:hypothetical protein